MIQLKNILSIVIVTVLLGFSSSTGLGAEPTADSVFGTKPKETQVSKKGGEKPMRPKVSRDEIFQRIDVNKDGRVSKEEFMSTKASKRSPTKSSLAFAKMDKNADGQLSLEEFKNPPRKN